MIGAFLQHRRSFRFSEAPRNPFRQYLKGLALAIACGWLGAAAAGQMTIPLDDPAGPQRPPPSFSPPHPTTLESAGAGAGFTGYPRSH